MSLLLEGLSALSWTCDANSNCNANPKIERFFDVYLGRVNN